MRDAISGSSDGFIRWRGEQLRTGEFKSSMCIAHGGNDLAVIPGSDVGIWTSPVVELQQPVLTINPSWRATTPPGTYIEVELRVQYKDRWSIWYNMGRWAFSDFPKRVRCSHGKVENDEMGAIETDTYRNTHGLALEAFQLRARLFAFGARIPRLHQLAAQVAGKNAFRGVSTTTMTETIDLRVPPFAQYAHEGEYPAYGGGREWCSPTSVAMMLKYFDTGPSAADLMGLPPDPVFKGRDRADGEVPFAALHVYDHAYPGTGNWSFNAAYMAHFGLDSSVRVFSSLREVEAEIKQGRPVVVSLGWNNEDPEDSLPGASIPASGGHLLVVRGFEADGTVITNDPAATNNEDVRRLYEREPFERQWLKHSNGTVYTASR